MELRLVVSSFCVFFSYLRISASVIASDGDRARAAGSPKLEFWTGMRRIEVKTSCEDIDSGWEVTLEGLVDPETLMETGRLKVVVDGVERVWTAAQLSADADARSASSLTATFQAMVREAAARGERPKMLDLGGRARSGLLRRDEYPDCDVTVFDLQAGPGVDVVGDAHELASHFPPEHFDFVLCVSVFEHLLMPWKAMLELNWAMKTGGRMFIHTHQTIGMHDIPCDYYRYSDTAWQGLFNLHTGFEILETNLAQFQYIIPRAWTPRNLHSERSGGFEGSSVIVRKSGRSDLAWPITLVDVTSQEYPG